ncbi:MAG: ATP-binding protein [Candidatus Dadabacteria bacterium]|nr:ATP-binding protein [Candidatus Dadabacteria bacterium]
MDANEYSAEYVARLFADLRLKGISEGFGERYAEFLANGQGVLDFLGKLLEGETGGRKQRRFERLVREGNLDMSDCLERYDFDLGRKHGAEPSMVRDLAGCEYVRKCVNVVLAGGVGTGKSKLARTLAFEAARRDFTACFVNTRELIEELYGKKDSYAFAKVYHRYVNLSLLCLDDLAYMPFAPEKVEYLFRLICDRTEKKTGSLVMTTNSDVREWWSFFPSKAMGMAFSDRVLGGAIGIKFTGPSIRSGPREGDDEKPPE